jgi:nitroimidazol reductase NimA-like FMN-containing flavoprotein (pyridoxamine 5'-phosphate oxidase superfamily)
VGRLGVDDLEDLKGTHLDRADQEELLSAQTECTVAFSDAEGWPRGVIMSFIVVDGRFWLTAVEGRAQVKAADRDRRVSIVVSSAGSGLPGRRMLSVLGEATVHRDDATLQWFLDQFTSRLQPADPVSWRRLLDSPNRVVFEVRPTRVAVSHDQRKIAGNGRGISQDSEGMTKDDPTMTADLAELGARSARLYYRYCRAVDEGDLRELREMVTDDVRITRGDQPMEHGVEAFLDVYRAHNALGIPVCKHVVSNVLAERQGSEIVTHAYFQATLLTVDETRVIFGVYDDVHVEVDGELKLAHKRITAQRTLHLPPAVGASYVQAVR